MVIGLTTTCVISIYHHWICEFEQRSWRGVHNATICDNVQQWVSPRNPVSSTNKTDLHDIAEIVFNVAVSTITKPVSFIWKRKPWNLKERIQFDWNNNELIQKLILTLFDKIWLKIAVQTTLYTLMSQSWSPFPFRDVPPYCKPEQHDVDL